MICRLLSALATHWKALLTLLRDWGTLQHAKGNIDAMPPLLFLPQLPNAAMPLIQ
jgi:hypothetical protein